MFVKLNYPLFYYTQCLDDRLKRGIIRIFTIQDGVYSKKLYFSVTFLYSKIIDFVDILLFRTGLDPVNS
jgi:hypothetical protein